MGNLSLRHKNVYDIPYVARYKRVYQAFQITPAELKKFHDLFAFFDTDHSGEIDLQEFFRHLDLGVTPFGDRIFHIMDEDGSGQIDFREFVMSLWNYCTLTSATLELFAFDLYDKDSTGELSVEEVHQMLQDMYGSESGRNQQARG
jgi:serine/threonine-protein phosphatase 2B regulatory subunit